MRRFMRLIVGVICAAYSRWTGAVLGQHPFADQYRYYSHPYSCNCEMVGRKGLADRVKVN